MEPKDPTGNPPSVPPLAAAAVPVSFNYEAQAPDGHRFSGTLDAINAEEASRRLESMRLRVVEVAPAKPLPRARPLRGDDFAAFNQQFAQLTAAGLPVEQGLRLIAADLRAGRMARTVEQLAAELERGTSLDQAFDKMSGQFPPLYGQLVRAGIKSGNLSAVLLNLGRHLAMVSRLRASLWRTVAYPLFVLLTLGILLSLLGMTVLPQFAQIYDSYRIELPEWTQLLLEFGRLAPVMLVALLCVTIGGPLVWTILRSLGYGPSITDRFAMSLPLIGPILRDNLLARWCDAARIAVDAGLDLPRAFSTAGAVTRSPRLIEEGNALSASLAAGQPLTTGETKVLPRSVPAALQFASTTHDLSTTLSSLAELYQRQAELRLASLPGILTPVLVAFIALLIGFTLVGLLWPLIDLLDKMTGGGLKL